MRINTPLTKFAAVGFLSFVLGGSCEGKEHEGPAHPCTIRRKNTFLIGSTSHILVTPRGGASRARSSRAAATSKPRARESITGGSSAVANADDFSIEAIVKGRWGIKDALAEFSVRHIKDAKRRVYLISFVLSVIYAFYFVKGYIPSCPNYSEGFCVTNLVDVGGEKTCERFPPGNSHAWAFIEDIVFTLIAIVLPFTKYSSENLDLSTKIGIPFIILSHGGIHGWISSNGCILSDSVKGVGTLLYTLFTGVLTAITFYFLSDIPEHRPPLFLWAEIVAITGVIVGLTFQQLNEGKSNLVSALFLASQLLVGYLGAFHPGKLATMLVGKTFIAPCVVSLIEYLKCDWLFPIGGHALYDFFLHISIVSALLPSE